MYNNNNNIFSLSLAIRVKVRDCARVRFRAMVGWFVHWLASRVNRGTCEAPRFDSNWTSRFDSKVTGQFENFESPCLPRFCRRTINNTHCSTTNFNRFDIATGIYIKFN